MFTQEVIHVALSYFEALDSPVSLSCALQLRAGEYVSLIKRSVQPHSYVSHEAYLRDVSAVAFLKKYSGSLEGLNPKVVAEETWLEGERRCYVTNYQLDTCFDRIAYNGNPVDPRFDAFVKRARQHVEKLIGVDPGFPAGRLGPGATLSDTYGSTDVINKFTSTPTLADHSFALLPLLNNAWGRAIVNERRDVVVARGNKYFQVPKTAVTNRSCAKEPSINAFVQLGLGGVMRTRMLRRGIDLRRSQDLHKKLAREASITSEMVTIDLSNASDTVSHCLVELLVPELWYRALAQARSRRTLFQGHLHVLEKFSSMGNGFTFELETTLFFAIACSVSPDLIPGVNVHVYGDDIIVPSWASRDVLACLSFWGFTPNVDKTFCDGPFRESCGGDYFEGMDVRPIQLRESPNEPSKLITLHNQLHRHQLRLRAAGSSVDLQCILRHIVSLLPREIQCCKGPPELGDSVLHCEEGLWRIRWRDGIRYIRSYNPVPTTGRTFASFSKWAQIAAAVYGITLLRNRVIGGGVSGFRLGWTPWS